MIYLYREPIWEFIQVERENFRYGFDNSVQVILYLKPGDCDVTGRISKSALCRDDELAVLRLEINRRRLWDVAKPGWFGTCINRSELIEMLSDRTMEFGYAPAAEEHIKNQIRDALSSMNEEMTSTSTAMDLSISLLSGYIPLSALDGAPKRSVIEADYAKRLKDSWADVEMFLELVGEDIFMAHFHNVMDEDNHSRKDLLARLEDVRDDLDPEETAICTRAIEYLKLMDAKFITP